MITHLHRGAAPDSVGGKGASWWRAFALGMRVPDGFIIPATYEPIREELHDALQALSRRSGCTEVAIRSSGATEDGHDRALAGLFLSELHIPLDATVVLETIARCRRSARTERARAAAATEDCPAVLVQEMIAPDWSGLLFSRDPLTGQSGLFIEAVEGHLEDLVDGAEPSLRAVLTSENHEPVRQKLGGDCTALLVQHARELESDLQGPVDIEWAIRNQQLIILQARPMTALTTHKVLKGLELVPVAHAHSERLPKPVKHHDKVSLRLLADRLRIPIANGLVALCLQPTAEDIAEIVQAVAGWSEFIAVLLMPFRWRGEILRYFGTGEAAHSCIIRFTGELSAHEQPFAFLLKELQPTSKTGIAIRLDHERMRVEVIQGHFASKGIEDATSYLLGPGGEVRSCRVGQQQKMATLERGQVTTLPVSHPARLDVNQLRELSEVMSKLATHYPEAGIEFGYTPADEFFLVDLYEGTAVMPPGVGDQVICEGRVIGRVRFLNVDDQAVSDSIERHIHNRRERSETSSKEPEILVVSRPFHVLDQFVYNASPNHFGMVFQGGSILCHLAVVMRECGIPGLLYPEVGEFVDDGDWVLLDTRPGTSRMLQKLSECDQS